MKYIKENLSFFIFMILICIVGGYFTTIYTISFYNQSTIEEAIKQIGSRELFIAISVIQISLYATVLGGFGIVLSNKIGLWKKFEKNKSAIIGTIIIFTIGGLAISVIDKYVFGSLINPVLHFYDDKPTIDYIISSLAYGGVFEELLMRLFLMSLFSWIIIKVFYRKNETIPAKVFIVSNILTAMLFAAGHIPSTKMLFGYIDALILFRCFLLNGAFGLAFGWLYRKYGIQYSMLAHFGCHLLSKIIWILFL